MGHHRLAALLPVAALLCAAFTGCQACHSYRPMPILVRDIETKQPIGGVEVRLSYPLTDANYCPWNSEATTGSDGIARLRAAPYGSVGLLAEVRAPGYLDEQKNIATATVEAIEPAHFFEDVEQRPPQLVVEMYAGPSPSVELVLPAGYRGMVKVDLVIHESDPCPAGQRSFFCEVSPAGTAQLTGPALLQRVFPPDFHARFEDGVVLSREPNSEEVGLWCLKFEDHTFHFFIGTREELERLHRPSLQKLVQKRYPSKRDAEEGQGRHRRYVPPTD
jgi:hypothetical protein